MNLEFRIHAREGKARTATITLNSKRLDTPAFIYAATYGQVNLIDPQDFPSLGIDAVMVNAFQLYRSREWNAIQKKGIAAYTHLNDQIVMSDSTGFQIMSYGDSRVDGSGKIAFPRIEFPYALPSRKTKRSSVIVNDEGARFFLEEGNKLIITPELSMRIQEGLQSDIAMAFDQCHTKKDYATTKSIMRRSHSWEQQSLNTHNPRQALYGIVHGGFFEDLRRESARAIDTMTSTSKPQGFDGYSVGGYMGPSNKEIFHVLDWVLPELNPNKPRHLLGLGRIPDLFTGVEYGVDTFDCVEVTKFGRHGWAFSRQPNHGTHKHIIEIKKSDQRGDTRPLDEECGCAVCREGTPQSHTRCELRALLTSQEREEKIKGMRLMTTHNIVFISNLMKDMRAAITEGRFAEMKKEWLV